MKFSLLLYGFYLILRFASWRKPSFRNRLKEKNFTMLIKTRDAKYARYYTFIDGKVLSEKGDHPNPDFSVIWSNADDGYKIMSRGGPADFTAAIRDDTLVIKDDQSIIMWFMETMNRLKSA